MNHHLKQRLNERYGISLNKKEFKTLNTTCRNFVNRGNHVRLSNSRSLVEIEYKFRVLKFIFSKSSKSARTPCEPL